MDGHDPAKDHWWYPGEAATIAAAGANDNFLDIFGNSTEHFFELVWDGGTGQPAFSRIRSSSLRATAQIVPPPHPAPSEDVMTALLNPTISGEDHVGDNSELLAKVKSEPSMAKRNFGTMASKYKGKIPSTEHDMSSAQNTYTGSDSSEWRKAASGWSSTTRSSHHSGSHKTTEMRRGCKISDRLRTLQQLVPGCDKVSSREQSQSNEESTLEQTIQYMKSLQQQVQSINMRSTASAAAAVYPTLVQPPPTAAVAMPIPAAATGHFWPGPVVPYGMIPYAHYHAVMMPAAASSAVPVMMPEMATTAAPEGQCSISRDQRGSSTRRKKGRGDYEFVRRD